MMYFQLYNTQGKSDNKVRGLYSVFTSFEVITSKFYIPFDLKGKNDKGDKSSGSNFTIIQ